MNKQANESSSQSATNTASDSEHSGENSGNDAVKQLETIRAIINKQALDKLEDQRKQEARSFVSEVLSEAINDRQQQDQSVSRILEPVVQSSVENAVKNQRQQMSDYLYPLVGDLVRKFSVAFLRDFIEKTNELIENSFTPKSLLWRIRAWRSGVSFSTYLASQTYAFQVHQVLLIHRETGILLNSQSASAFDQEDSDLVSAMLTAINDFVGDSFANKSQLLSNKGGTSQETQLAISDSVGLHEIKTDEFTLYIKQGPQALLVAAVTGNISPFAKTKLQETLEQIHALYLPQLQNFDGETEAFKSCDSSLRECLMKEQRNEKTNKKRKPWMALMLVGAVLLAIMYYLFLLWQTHSVKNKLRELPSEQGIVINSASVVGVKEIELHVLRDPNAVSLEQWLASHPDSDLRDYQAWMEISQTSFLSLSPTVINKQVQDTVIDTQSNLSENETLSFDPAQHVIEGKLSSAKLATLKQQLQSIPGIGAQQLTYNLDLVNAPLNDKQVNKQLLSELLGQIAQIQLEFDVGSAELSDAHQQALMQIYELYTQVQTLAEQQGNSTKLLVLGSSDNIGNPALNRKLSVQRAKSATDRLIQLGISPQNVMQTSAGVMENVPADRNARKAMFYVIMYEN